MGVASHIGDGRPEHDIPAAPAQTLADGAYEAALANLLAHVLRRAGGLHRLQRTGWAVLTRSLRRWRDEINRYPPEYWFM
jgi:hypothetical protein